MRPQTINESLRLYCLNLNDSITAIEPGLAVDITVHDQPLELERIEPQILHERLSRGERIFLASHKSKLAAYLFATENKCWVNEIEDNFFVHSGDIYFYDAYTYPQFQGNRIYPMLITYAAKFYKNLSFSNALIFTTASNIPSIKGIESAGFNCYQIITFSNRFGFKTWQHNTRNDNVKSRFSNEI